MARKVKGKECIFSVDIVQHTLDLYACNVFAEKELLGHVKASNISELFSECLRLMVGGELEDGDECPQIEPKKKPDEEPEEKKENIGGDFGDHEQ